MSSDHDPLFPDGLVAPSLPSVLVAQKLVALPCPVPPVPPPVAMMVPPVPDKEDSGPPMMIADSDDEDEYVDIDASAVECDAPVTKARPSDTQVTSSRANT